QPSPRWWEFEDAVVSFGALDVTRTDIGKLILMDFTLTCGDDWFIVPLTVSTNSLVRIRGVVVRDSFGLTSTIQPARTRTGQDVTDWEVFVLSGASAPVDAGDFLFVPPVGESREESPVLEEVRFGRDEDANVVFAIEETVQNQMGEPVGGAQAH